MALTKIGDWEHPVVNEADRPSRTAADMKAVFDSNSNQIREAFNALVDDIESGNASMRFTQAAERANVESGDSLETILGKISKTFQDAELAVSTVKQNADHHDRYLSLDGTYSVPEAGAAENGVAMGGTAGQIYVKQSAADFDGDWETVTPSDIGAAAAVHHTRHENGGADAIDPAKLGVSNPNLLHNPNFVIRQRGVTSGPTTYNTYALDRWKWDYTGSAGTFSTGEKSVTLTPASGGSVILVQPLERPGDIAGRVVTGSVKMYNGNVYRGTVTRTSDTLQTLFPASSNEDRVGFAIDANNAVRISCGLNKTILAVKLELGPYATIENDPVADSAAELKRCQRFAAAINASSSYSIPIGFGYATSSTNFRFHIPLPATMRGGDNPVLTDTGLTYGIASKGAYFVPQNKAVVPFTEGSKLIVNFTGSGFTQNDTGVLYITGQSGYTRRLIVSNDL